MTGKRILLVLVFVLAFGVKLAHGETHFPKDSASLQAVLMKSAPGDEIHLVAGATYIGQFVFPTKAAPGVVLRTAGPLPDRRIGPGDAPNLATVSSGVAAFTFAFEKSSNWTIDGVRFLHNVGGFGEVISIQDGENITLRRVLIDIPDPEQQKRFILGNGKNIHLLDSHCGGVWRSGQDSQCFAAWDGAGPYTLINNYLEAASENVMFGGADSTAAERLPRNIRIERNHFTKRLAWKGQTRGVKNLFELKAACDVYVGDNTFEHNWIDAQSGHAIVFTPRNQDNKAPWSQVCNVVFEKNVVRDVPSALNVTGYDDLYQSQQTKNIIIRDNLFLAGSLGLFQNEIDTLTLDRNTFVNLSDTADRATFGLYAEGKIPTATGSRTPAFAVNALTVTGNVFHSNEYGIHSSSGLGAAALKARTVTYTWMNNAIIEVSQWLPQSQVLTLAQLDPVTYVTPGFGWSGGVLPPTPPEPIPPPPPPPPAGDTTPPTINSFAVTRSSGVHYRATVNADDDVIVARFDVFVDDRWSAGGTSPSTGSFYTAYVRIQGKGKTVVKVVVYDATGNKSEAVQPVVR